MNIEKLEDCLETIDDPNMSAIIELIVNAVRDYPSFGLTDTDEYFSEVKKILMVNEITFEKLTNYLNSRLPKEDESSIWIKTSLGSLTDAFSQMKLYKISFENVLSKLQSLEKQ